MKYVYLLIALFAFSCASKEKRSASMEIPEPAVASDSSSTGASTEPSASAAANAESAKSTAAAEANSPRAVCENLAQAAVKKDWNAFREYTVTGMQTKGIMGRHHKKGFEKMGQEYMSRLKDLSCNKEKIAGDHAIVEAKSGNEERLIPFVRVHDGWKFDEGAYHAFYSEKHERAEKSM